MKTRIRAYSYEYERWVMRDNLLFKHNLFMSDFINQQILKISKAP